MSKKQIVQEDRAVVPQNHFKETRALNFLLMLRDMRSSD
jgi:hypothetical protein